jgi:hypothetical protein
MPPGHSYSRISQIVLEHGLVDELQLNSAKARLEKWGGRLPAILVEMGFVDDQALAEVIGKALKMPVMSLRTVVRDPAALSRLHVSFAEQHGVFPVHLKDRALSLAMVDPSDLGVIDTVAAKAAARIVPLLAPESEVATAIARHYHGQRLEAAPRSARRAVAMNEAASPTDNNGLLQLDLRRPPRASPSSRSRHKSANTLLDEMLAGDEAHGFSETELARLKLCLTNQDKASTIIRAIRELLAEKGFSLPPL